MGGGLQYGTSAVLLGPAGSGKSTLAIQYARAAAARGERAAIFAFDERLETILERTEGLGMDIAEDVESGLIRIQPIDPAELSPGEFAHRVRAAVEGADGTPGARVVVIDSLNGYLNAMPEERFLIAQLHELLTYLGHKGVVTFLVVAQHGLVGQHAVAHRHDLSRRHGRPLPLLRGDGRGEAGHLGRQEAERQARADHPRAEARRAAGSTSGQPLRGFPRGPHGDAVLPRAGRPAREARRWLTSRPPELEERILLLAPTKRDAAAAVKVFEAVGIALTLCEDIAEVCSEIERGAAVAIVPDEAILDDKEGCLARLLQRAAPLVRLPAHRPDAARTRRRRRPASWNRSGT